MDQWAAERFQVALSAVDDDSAERFVEATPMLVSSVNRLICSRDDIAKLIGGNDTSVVQTNHANHAHFMSSQFYLRSAQTVMQTIDWVYRSYRERGFSERY